jgi:excisionase family DNA binding protein
MEKIGSYAHNLIKMLEESIEAARKAQRFDSVPQLAEKLKDLLHSIPADDSLWTIEQASDYLGIAPSTIRKKCSAKQIPYIDIGAIRFDRQDLQKWVGRHRVEVNKAWR